MNLTVVDPVHFTQGSVDGGMTLAAAPSTETRAHDQARGQQAGDV